MIVGLAAVSEENLPVAQLRGKPERDSTNPNLASGK